MEKNDIEHVISSCEIFEGLDKEHVEKIAALCQIKSYGPGDYVFRQGDFGEDLYIIPDGHVYLERTLDLGARKGCAVLGILGKGRVFGCWSVLFDEPHNLMSSASCRKPTQVIAIKGTDLRDMLKGNTEIGYNILKKLCFI